MKLLHISYSDGGGGAGNAAYNLVKSLKAHTKNEIDLIVTKKLKNDTSRLKNKGYFRHVVSRCRSAFAWYTSKYILGGRFDLRSINLLPSFYSKVINKSSAQIVHLHWICFEDMSLSDIANIEKPVVWTLHDLWPIAGIEHVPIDQELSVIAKIINNYCRHKKNKIINKQNFNYIAPSKYVADYVKNKYNIPPIKIKVISNAINDKSWFKIDKADARLTLGVSPNCKVILFNGSGGLNNYNKGFDLLCAAIRSTDWSVIGEVLLAIIADEKQMVPKLPIPTMVLPVARSEDEMRHYYSITDVVVVTSRFETFGLVTLESLFCEVPVICFQSTGSAELVKTWGMGTVIDDLDVIKFGQAIKQTLFNKNINDHVEGYEICRKIYNSKRVALDHHAYYKEILASTDKLSNK